MPATRTKDNKEKNKTAPYSGRPGKHLQKTGFGDLPPQGWMHPMSSPPHYSNDPRTLSGADSPIATAKFPPSPLTLAHGMDHNLLTQAREMPSWNKEKAASIVGNMPQVNDPQVNDEFVDIKGEKGAGEVNMIGAVVASALSGGGGKKNRTRRKQRGGVQCTTPEPGQWVTFGILIFIFVKYLWPLMSGWLSIKGGPRWRMLRNG